MATDLPPMTGTTMHGLEIVQHLFLEDGGNQYTKLDWWISSDINLRQRERETETHRDRHPQTEQGSGRGNDRDKPIKQRDRQK